MADAPTPDELASSASPPLDPLAVVRDGAPPADPDDKRPEAREPKEAKEVKEPEASWWATQYPRGWSFVNSSFGLWFLSSVVVGGVVSGYSLYAKSREQSLKKLEFVQVQEAKQKALIEKLDLEIGYRFSFALQQLADLDAKKQQCTAATDAKSADCPQVVADLNAIFGARGTPLAMYPDFKAYSTVALIAELKRVLPTDQVDEAASLKQVLYDMSGLYTMLDVQGAKLDEPRQVAGAILKKLVLPRWKQGFYYNDCSPASPFC